MSRLWLPAATKWILKVGHDTPVHVIGHTKPSSELSFRDYHEKVCIRYFASRKHSSTRPSNRQTDSSSTTMSPIPIVPVRCANWTPDESCTLEGSFVCKNCKLVAVSLTNHTIGQSLILTHTKYCGAICQKLHWPNHKLECRSPLNKSSWIPEWDRTNRAPIWAIGEASQNLHNPFGSSKYLWGNVPAIDILRISRNEGESYDRNIKLLFAGELTTRIVDFLILILRSLR